MSLETRSFFIGIATVAGLVVLGFGGGILMGGVLSGDSKPNKVERQAAAKVETPVQPAIAEAQVKPVPVAEPKPVVEPKPAVVEARPAVTASPADTSPPVTAPPAPQPVLRAETAPLPFAPPRQAAQQEPAKPVASPEQKSEQNTAAAAATPAGSSLNADPVLGPQRPVALTPQPLDQTRSLSRREEARLRSEQRRAEREQRRAERELRREERRKLVAERRDRDLSRREEMRSERLKRQDLDEDDEDDERPVAREHVAPRAPDLPFFRIFGN